MNVLAIDTATDTLAIALRSPGHSGCLLLRAGLKHSEMLLPRVDSMLRAAGLEPGGLQLLVCSVGPGSFTGVRIGLATAKGLARGAGARLVGVSTLDGLAWRYRGFAGTVAAVNPSLRKRLYGALFRQGSRVGDYLELLPEEMAEKLAGLAGGSPLLLTGAAALDVQERLGRAGQPALTVVDGSGAAADPTGLLETGLAAFQAQGGEEPPEVLPLYLRPSEAELGFKQ